MRTITRIPAAVLLVVLGLLPLQAWLRAGRPDVRYSRPLDGLEDVTWAGTVAPDGRLAVTIVYDFGDRQSRESSIRLPSGARFLHADGVPVAASNGRYTTVSSQGTLTVTYERVGAVTRYDDGVIVDLSGIERSDEALFPCARCYLGVDGYGNSSIHGALFADDLTGARIAVRSVDQLRTGHDDGALRFVGVLPGADDAGMLVWLPLTAAPDAPSAAEHADDRAAADSVTGDSAAEVWDATRGAAKRAGEALHEARARPPIGRIAAAVLLTAMWLVLVAWIAWRILDAKRALDADAPDAPADRDAAFSPPSALEPALVAAVVGDAGRGKRSAVAATLLSLAHRGVLRIEGVDSERYTLTIPPGARGSTPFEEAVLAELRPQGQVSSTATLTGPPLWGATAPAVARRLTRLAAKQARKARLIRVTLAAGVLIPASLAMGIVALIASGGSSWLAWLVAFAGPVLALVATLLTGTNLTAKGRAERERWLEYGDWLRANSQLHEVGAPGVATWGEPLVYATVLGAAPKAAEALGVG